MYKNVKYYISVLIILAISGYLLHNLVRKYEAFEQQRIDAQLSKAHNDAITNAKAGIEVYASLVSGLKSFTQNSKEFPSEIQLQNYLNDFLKEIQFNDSILVNYIDANHVFKYVITPKEIDPNNLKGISVKSIKPPSRIEELNELMKSSTIKLFTPINLREGWAGFPFNFSARNANKESFGYVTPILNVKYLLDYFYERADYDMYVHKFLINDSIDLTREAFYNGSEIFNTSKDKEYYKNFNVSDNDFIYSTIQLFGLKLKIGSAYKKTQVIDKKISNIAYLWYGLLSLLIFVTLHQFLKNRTLNSNLQEANAIVISKNRELENNLTNIQTLIKEIHHRVKNNMQMISGILLLQEGEYEDKNIKNALRDSRSRIKSMALVHQKLYGTHSLKHVKIKEYIAQLIHFIEDIVRNNYLEIVKEINIDETLVFDGDTTANLGLIINELITNSFKYAFKTDQKNGISISIEKQNSFYKLTYIDTGEGLQKGFDLESTTSLGIQLIKVLTNQLNGVLVYERTPEKAFVIYFKPITPSFSV